MTGYLLFEGVIYLAAAIFCVPIAKRLGMGSVLGYLLAGIIIGPFVLGFVGQEGEDIMHFAEFGVVMMLFLVGLELEPQQFWRMRRSVLGMGASQVLLTAALLSLGGYLLGLDVNSAIAGGLALSLSSTAIGLQTLKEKNLLNTSAGQSSFSVLLFQDIAVIPMLALIPLLATGTHSPTEAIDDHAHSSTNLIEALPAWTQALVVLAAIASIVVLGRFVIGPLLRIVAKTRLRELFTASALFIVVGISFVMELVGLSHALGAFLAGVVLANSEYKHALESDLDPFKGLLLGLFFMAVGASIDFRLISENPGEIAALVFAIIVVKGAVLFAIGKVFRLALDQNLLFALGLSQVGEFAFVLFSFIGQWEIMDPETNALLMGVVAISMVLTPLLLLVNDQLIRPRFGTKEEAEQEPDEMDESNPVIIAGFSHFGSVIGRLLRAYGIEATILDKDSDRVDVLRKMGFKVFYGDATRVDLLESAGAAEAKLFISAIDSPETNRDLVEKLQKHFPHLQLMIRAHNRVDAYEMMEMGVADIYRESFDTAVRMGVDVLRKMGFRAYTAERAGHLFAKQDEASMHTLISERKNRKNYIVRVREEIAGQEEILQADKAVDLGVNDHAWDTECMREADPNPDNGAVAS